MSNDLRIFGLLRSIREAAQYLQARIPAAAKTDSPAAALPAALHDRIAGIILPALDSIGAIFASDEREFEWCADNVVAIRLEWSEVEDLWPDPALPPPAIGARLARMSAALDSMVYHCATLSLSPRVNAILKNLRIGQPLDFEFEFGPELPLDPALRRRLLLELAQESAAIESGVVDPAAGVIYRAAVSRSAQRRSALELAAIVAAGTLFPFALAGAGKFIVRWPFQWTDWRALLADYLLVLAGSSAHLALDAVKAAKRQDRPGFQALNDWILWLSVRQFKLIWGILYVWTGYFLLVFTLPALGWESAFFAGYSIDSWTELVLERFEGLAKARETKMLSG